MNAIQDPLAAIPRPEEIRRELGEAEALAKRLKILLRTSERIYRVSGVPASGETVGKGVSCT